MYNNQSDKTTKLSILIENAEKRKPDTNSSSSSSDSAPVIGDDLDFPKSKNTDKSKDMDICK